VTATRVLLQRDMKCDEKARLLGAYNRATLASSMSIENLLHGPGLHGPGTASSVIYDMRRHAAEKARTGFELARLAYDAHVRQHDCETSQDLSPQLPAHLTESARRAGV
jgi:hypothetical protein